MFFKGRLMSVFESILLVFNERATTIQFFYYFTDSLDWIGCGSEYTELSWIGLDWIKLLDWVGLDLAKWTHVQLCVRHDGQLITRFYRLYQKTTGRWNDGTAWSVITPTGGR